MHGDRNTAFFHQKTLTRRRRNRIDAIQSDTGEWLYNVADIKSQWNIVGPSFCLFIREIFSSGNIPSEINKTLVVLIPKTDHLISFRMYRPISLCTVTYKTVTKIIANRLKAILPELIGPHQTSFVPGRHIIENIVVAQEIIHSMRRKTGNRGQMAIKVDLEKAYDRLSWDFIQDTLLETGLPTDFVHITMNCITTARMNVLWEGECTDDFIPSRGIRQGDPISPYIFVLFIERLSHGICHAVNMGEWKPIRLARHGTPLTLFFFADDLLLLAEASCDQAKVLNTVLDVFCTSSGEKVNKAITHNFFLKMFPQVQLEKLIINKTAAEFVDAQGNWNWVTFSHLLPNNILLRIASFRPPMEGYGEDQIFWSESKKGNFTVKSAYDALSKELKGDDDQIWSCVWRWNGPQSIRVFLWLVLYNRLKTKAEISRRHVHLDSSCDRCGDGDENTLHVLRDCMVARRFWYAILPIHQRQYFFSLNLKDWMSYNLMTADQFGSDLSWNIYFGVAIWRLWFWRNKIFIS
ncbi:putative ribonuclease H protein [Citrus sinensis]|uniref:Ribonuclease H protein n=1 Tax=Citrus sinensis TaxID=2711 RepID=A0ACB8JS80_CITSI|nr:putative ribonuclease H protein [Citrus sinensis]